MLRTLHEELLGQTAVILTKSIDLSVAANLSFTGMAVAMNEVAERHLAGLLDQVEGLLRLPEVRQEGPPVGVAG